MADTRGSHTRQKDQIRPPYLLCYDLPVTTDGPKNSLTLAEQTAWRECARLQQRVAELEAENAQLKQEARIVAWRLLRQAGFFDQEERQP